MRQMKFWKIAFTMLVVTLFIASCRNDEHRIRKVYLLTNTDHTNEHFSIDPREQLKAVRDMRENGLQPLGNWHSHPETPSRPSEEDKRLANDRKASYLILSLAEKDHPVLNAFHIENGADGKIAVKEDLFIGGQDDG